MIFHKNIKYILSAVLGLILLQPMMAQDGKEVFKAKCAACHNMKQKLVGPALKGVVAKWEEAGEGEMLADWIKDPAALKASGKSKMAVDIWDFSPADMTPNPGMSDEEIASVIQFMKDWAPPTAKTTASGTTGGQQIVVQEDNAHNTFIFILLMIIIVMLLVSIVVLGRMIKQVALKNMKVGNVPVVLMGLIVTFLLPQSGYALSIDFSSEPWIEVSSSDNYFLVGIIIILFALLLYMKSMLTQLIKRAYSDKIAFEEKSVLLSLTEVVPLEQEDSILMDHEYDGIRELDNVLPPWWLWMFYITIIFAVVYLFNYHVFKTGDLQIAEYESSMEAAQIEIDAYNKKHSMTVDLASLEVMTDESDIAAGEKIFKKKGNCFTCHLQNASGQIGPNLTDDFWLYDNDIISMYNLIHDGTDKGMPPMGGSSLNPIEIQQVASYILQLEFVEGKAPEGTEK